MIRKLFMLLLCLALLSPAALAEESVLPVIEEPSAGESILPRLETLTAVSYGVEMNVYPALTRTLESGEWQESYTDVTLEKYDAFGVRLGQLGCTTDDVAVEGCRVSLTLVDGDVRIGFLYDSARHVLTMTYPAGVETGVDAIAPVTARDHINETVDVIEGYLEEAYTLFQRFR